MAVRAARATLGEARTRVLAGSQASDDLAGEAQVRAAATFEPTLKEVINATGVILHTNLGRAPLPAAARDAVTRAAEGYSNLEYDLETGRRGSRQDHVESLAAELTGADAALVVNNGAAAVLVASAALAGRLELIVSRGQLIEIGDAFRIPSIVAQSGATLVEVGTTNRTHVEDYAAAMTESTGAILRVHQSNFRSLGFVEDVAIEDLCRLGAPVIDDLGSGVLAEHVAGTADEPSVRRSIEAGCAAVCCSGDKLLGGPQAGLVVGRREAIARCRAHPLARVVRIDKLSLAALEATLRLYLDPGAVTSQVPVLAMLTASDEALRARAEAIRSGLSADGAEVEIVETSAKVGGGALPLLELTGPACSVDPAPHGLDQLTRRLRSGAVPVVGRARERRLLLDPRTVADGQVAALVSAVSAALG
ncbi:MAG TPA: L-seryl-tRNA(Sec) selenium transferase [Thermoleophilaceae bacterium]|nr:L-seryl-tRNA(Sec) selenium transferase [Thermoleophilaceae bacterium]